MALQQMIADVESGVAEFSVILVYDVFRWGRFQDTDESAFYEYRCRKAGMQVAYCAEQFENDGAPASTIVKSVKRAMAGEYSRELSVKVFAGQCRLTKLGYRQGGPAGFGLRRALLNERGEVKTELKRGEHKSLQTDRVVLVPGPDEEARTVRWIYSQFLKKGLSESEIAAELTERGILTDLGRAWNRATVHQILTNENYTGNNVYNRRSFKLKHKPAANGPEMWIRSDGAFDAIVGPKQFRKAQAIIAARKVIAHELLVSLKGSASVDWSHRESARARMRVLVKRILRKHGFPSDLQDAAVQTVLRQAEALSSQWAV
ncbi:DNA invertase Pin-like site-specific DNA recombinase [Rhodovulum kholense]|uniref:DNA invertase Pin-like site-specific DNA recombinase n=2 Tax=Rhodovulum kholense TaxID=453584 RepID=A0A8E2VKH6_9RHOB|nr:DNA invertase Pin-like site-specific DNA recombinase [Rhodovulum kholense]